MCFFNPKLKLTKVRQVELNRLNDRKKKKRHICASTTKKSVERRKKKKKKIRGTLSQTFNEHFTVRDF